MEKVAHFFVDEAGDLTLFDRKGQVIEGEAGVSRTFMLGIAESAAHEILAGQLEVLRNDLLNDPYFANVPSMRTTAGKTASPSMRGTTCRRYDGRYSGSWRMPT